MSTPETETAPETAPRRSSRANRKLKTGRLDLILGLMVPGKKGRGPKRPPRANRKLKTGRLDLILGLMVPGKKGRGPKRPPRASRKLRTGRLDLILGPMVSGKTGRMISNLTRYADIKYRVGYVNHVGDVRVTSGGDGHRFTSHSSTLQQISPKISCFRVSDLGSLNVEDLDVVGVDEAHFYGDLYETVLRWVETLHKHVIVCGLDGSYRREPIGDILKLIPLSDTVKKMPSQCMRCIEETRASTVDFEASFTIRTTADTDPLLPGGLEKYEPVCRYHWLEFMA